MTTTKSFARRDEDGCWHPARYEVPNLLDLIGVGALTSNVVKGLAREHLQDVLPIGPLDLVFSFVETLDSPHDSSFFTVLHSLAASLLCGMPSEQKTMASFIKNSNLFPSLKKKGTKKHILIISRVPDTAKPYLATLLRWYYSMSVESRGEWLGRFEGLLVLWNARDERDHYLRHRMILKLIDATYRVSAGLHRFSYDRAHRNSPQRAQEIIRQLEMVHTASPNFQQLSAEQRAFLLEKMREEILETCEELPFVPLKNYVCS